MSTRKLLGAVAATATAMALTACGSSGGQQTGSPSASATASSAASTLKTASTSLGTVVVDNAGRTVYVFDKDTKGTAKSACTGPCMAKWPPVPAGAAPKADGVSGTLGSITGNDGTKQLTLNGWPLYYFASDKDAGSVAGQGVQKVWWVVSPTGDKVTETAAPSSDQGGGY
ncbi:COG4315 family predicted lipoprotein [Flexivirga meconopsidis]|uniref:COG4315 family predicted lipoprotein n=1 Tax=Flexivirga meconopsidis TaxID=2977121 RepID=UPI00224074B9|nr:hypothetical protein [Flexivirga meconopsidis]